MAPSPQARALLACVPVLLLAASPAHAQDGETGLLHVTATVEGAQVYVDNQVLGQTPITSYLPPGNHMVRVAADDFDPFVRRVTIYNGRTVELAADLLPGKGTVEFVVEPSGATLTLNERDEYPTPVRLRDLQPGQYRWALTATGHEPEEGEFTFEVGKNLLIIEQLDSSRGRFSVTSRPEGADVYLDGQHIGVTPIDLEGVEPGLHQVLLDMKGQASVLRTIDTSDGSKGEISARLPDKGASLVVKTPSSHAVVRLNGVRVGVGRKVKLPELERGRYTLQVTAPGMASAEERIEVPDSGGTNWRARLGDDGGQLTEYTPLTRSWAFWAGSAAVAGGAAAGGIIAYNASIPDPTPVGDILVTLP